VTEPPATLADLVSPLGEDEFFALLRKREFAFRRGGKGDCYAPLLGWKSLRQMIAAMDYPTKRPNDIKVTRESVTIPPERWTTEGKVDPAKLDALLAKGFSVVVLRVLAEHVPALAVVCDEITRRTHDQCFVAVVVTSCSAGGALKLHFDTEDLVILQVEGTKRWQVFGSAVPNPVSGAPKKSLPDPEQLIFDEVLEPGDLLFMPAGYWHHCECGPSTSVHLGVIIVPPTGWHTVNNVVQSVLSDDLFRTPLTRLDGTGALEAVEAEIKCRLIEEIGALKLTDFIARWEKTAH
jgi:Cupin superfamily protein